MHIESKNYDFLMYTLNAGKPVPSLYTQLGDMMRRKYVRIKCSAHCGRDRRAYEHRAPRGPPVASRLRALIAIYSLNSESFVVRSWIK